MLPLLTLLLRRPPALLTVIVVTMDIVVLAAPMAIGTRAAAAAPAHHVRGVPVVMARVLKSEMCVVQARNTETPPLVQTAVQTGSVTVEEAPTPRSRVGELPALPTMTVVTVRIAPLAVPTKAVPAPAPVLARHALGPVTIVEVMVMSSNTALVRSTRR